MAGRGRAPSRRKTTGDGKGLRRRIAGKPRKTGSRSEGVLSADVLEIMDALPFYVILVDESHFILSANKAVTEQLKVDRDSLAGQYCPKAIHGTVDRFPGCPLEEAVHKDRGVEVEYFDNKTGKWMESAIYPTNHRTKEGRRVYFHSARDVTERKLMQATLAGMERLASLGQFSGGVSHELRDPLTVIGVSAQILQARLKDARPEVVHELERIETQLGRCWATIEALLSLASAKEPKLEELDVLSAVCKAIEDAEFPETIEVIERLPDEEILVRGDWHQLRIAFLNLLVNARQVLKGKGRVTISGKVTDDHRIEVAIADNGPGIRPQDIPAILAPFHTTRSGGWGLGLSITKAIVERHQGTLKVVPQTKKGATFVIGLPVVAQPSESLKPEAGVRRSG